MRLYSVYDKTLACLPVGENFRFAENAYLAYLEE